MLSFFSTACVPHLCLFSVFAFKTQPSFSFFDDDELSTSFFLFYMIYPSKLTVGLTFVEAREKSGATFIRLTGSLKFAFSYKKFSKRHVHKRRIIIQQHHVHTFIHKCSRDILIIYYTQLL